MKIEFLHKFSKDIDKINSPIVKKSVISLIKEIEAAKSIKDIRNIKKLTGFKSAYRIRLGQYRVGLFIERNIAQFARIAHRKDIYHLFP